MSNNLFRKKSIEHISSPEQLNDYICVSTPSVWMLLIAIVILLTGVCVWGVFGHMDTMLPAVTTAQDGAVTAYVREAEISRIQVGMPVKVSGSEGVVVSVASQPVRVDETFTDYMLHVSGLQESEWVYAVTLNVSCPDGVHTAEITTERVSPMSFVLN